MITATSTLTALMGCYFVHLTVWTWMCRHSEHFASLPQHIQRHASDLVTRFVVGVPTSIVSVALVAGLFAVDRSTWLTKPYGFLVSNLGAVHVALDVYDLTQRRRFDWQVVVHHSLEILLLLVFFELYPAILEAQPQPEPSFVIIAMLGAVGRTCYFPFGYQMMFEKNPEAHVAVKLRRQYAFGFVLHVSLALIALILSVGYYVQHGSDIPTSVAIPYWVLSFAFPVLDLPTNVLLYKRSYFCHHPKSIEKYGNVTFVEPPAEEHDSAHVEPIHLTNV